MKSKGQRLKVEKVEIEERLRKPGQVPGKTIEAREAQLIALAYDLVEERMRKKTATSQETTQFIKAGSILTQLEKEKLKREIDHLKAKAESLESQKNVEKMYNDAMIAFKTYSGQEVVLDDD